VCALASNVEAGDGGGVSARADGEFFVAVEDAVVGVFDDDGDEFSGVAGPELDVLLVDHDAAAGVDAALSA
jgi:hypothetical protein